MSSSINYYKQQKDTYFNLAQNRSKQMRWLSILRLAIFVLTGFGVYLSRSNWQVATIITVVGVVAFLYVLLRYNSIKKNRDFNRALVNVNEDEIKIASGDFFDRNDGLKHQDPKHFYSLDIDLFGRGSFFQFINRTTIPEGEHKLAAALKANNIAQITTRQEAIKELSAKAKWRQYFTANSSFVNVEVPEKTIIKWLKNYNPFLSKAIQWLPLLFTIITTAILGLTFLKILNPEFIGYWLFIGLGISGIYLKKINALSAGVDRVKDTFRQYVLLLDLIENENFTSALLKQKKKQIELERKKASVIFKDFSRAIDALDNRNNMIGAIFGNGFFLTDIKNSYRIEKWIVQYGEKVSHWFDAISFFDAYNSLGGFVFNHPEFVFPEITKDHQKIKIQNLGHPMLNKNKRVDNNLHINNHDFFIVTGANMAGKSTFLRSVALHIVMANVGLPVCASKAEYMPVKLITSMRTSDSLVEDSSYFFAELTRLKYIVDTIKDTPYFIVLDEILKGTNSVDKAQGSKKFIEKLVASQATGIIATHDLSLCDIEEQLNQVHNYYFDAEIIEDELYFDYKFKKGICEKMNASFLLKKMNII